MIDHRDDCRFGAGFYRIVLSNGERRYCQTEKEVRVAVGLLGIENVLHVQRDACLDEPDDRGVVDGERWLELPRADAMAVLGIDSEADYVRAYRQVEEAVLARDRHTAPGEPRPSVVIKKKGVPVSDV